MWLSILLIIILALDTFIKCFILIYFSQHTLQFFIILLFNSFILITHIIILFLITILALYFLGIICDGNIFIIFILYVFNHLIIVKNLLLLNLVSEIVFLIMNHVLWIIVYLFINEIFYYRLLQKFILKFLFFVCLCNHWTLLFSNIFKFVLIILQWIKTYITFLWRYWILFLIFSLSIALNSFWILLLIILIFKNSVLRKLKFRILSII